MARLVDGVQLDARLELRPGHLMLLRNERWGRLFESRAFKRTILKTHFLVTITEENNIYYYKNTEDFNFMSFRFIF